MFPNLLLNPDFASLDSLYDYLYNFWLIKRDRKTQTKIYKKRFQFIQTSRKTPCFNNGECVNQMTTLMKI
jgi:hypothetical protein